MHFSAVVSASTALLGPVNGVLDAQKCAAIQGGSVIQFWETGSGNWRKGLEIFKHGTKFTSFASGME